MPSRALSSRRDIKVILLALCAIVSVWLFSSSPAGAVGVVIGEESFSGVGSSSATLNAQVTPAGSATTGWFEYGTSTSYGSSTPAVSLGSGAEALNAPAQLTGLQPETTYHFRAAVSDSTGTTEGTDETFTTLAAAASGLPDARTYELITAPDNGDAEAFVPTAGGLPVNEEDGIYTQLPFQASLDGNAMAYVARPSSGEQGGNGIYGAGAGNEFLARRSADGAWTREDLQARGVINSGYQAFSPDLSFGVLDSYKPLAAGLPENVDVLYARDLTSGAYRSLLTPPPGTRYLAAAGVIGDENYEPLAYAGASADFGAILFEADAALTANASDGGERENNLYDSLDGQLQLVNVLPDGSSEANATFGGPPFNPNEDGPDLDHVISTDGSRIFWSSLDEEREPKALYVREDGSRTTQLDAVQGGSGAGGGGRFWTASADGSRVFFTDADTAGLTADTHVGSGVNLYEFDLGSGTLTDLTSSADARVHGVVASGEDGAFLYFVAGGALGAGATSLPCEEGPGIASSCNLYVRHGGVTRYIATLSSLDGHDVPPFHESGGQGENGDWQLGLGHRTAEATPDGHELVFMSRSSLTGYPGEGTQEVYVYDSETGQLACASCSQSGEAPPLSEPEGQAAGFLPISHSNTRQQRWLSADGSRVFFDSAVPLVAQDTNGKQDVYEWERDGAGGCERNGGCVRLLSGGKSTSSSWLLDSSASGDDVFIDTRARLLPQDQNEAYDVYDVHVGGTQPLSAPACSGSGCQGVPPAPAFFATPPSVTFNGVGNFPPPAATKPKARPKSLTRAQQLAKALKACRSERKAKRATCQARARKRYGTGSAVKQKPDKKSAKRSKGRR